MFHIESLLSARLFIDPQIVGERIFFISNLSGRLSLYAMNFGGSVPEPLLPPNIAMQNPHLIGGHPFFVYPKLGKIVVMLDQDGDEIYQPMFIGLDGGFPEPVLDGFFCGSRVHLIHCDAEDNTAYFSAESQTDELQTAFFVNFETGEKRKLAASPWGAYPSTYSKDHQKAVLIDSYETGDNIAFLWENGMPDLTLIFGKPLEAREPDESIPFSAISAVDFLEDGKSLLIASAIFEDTYGLGIISLSTPNHIEQIKVEGLVHTGIGELENVERLHANHYVLTYNIDGVSWVYEAELDVNARKMIVLHTICGEGELVNGMLNSMSYEKSADRFVLSFSTAVSPTQIFTVEGKDRKKIIQHTHEKVRGIPKQLLSVGEDASFVSFDGTRVSARLYLPAKELGFQGPRPLVYYVHGGPQGQERPDFSWFSMPIIQYLTLNGFAVFVPNVRGSTGYGLSYTKQVDRDWGGKDREDHVYALTMLGKDPRIDTKRAGVVGRSYGGYMTLTLAARHPELWKAAVDMFGPFDLLTFLDRIPETWKPYYRIALGDVVKDKDFLVERSPKTYIEQITCPLLVIQGKNDPRVVEQESHDLVDYLRGIGKQVDYLMFENEGHDVLKYENRVRCYLAITDYFVKYLQP